MTIKAQGAAYGLEAYTLGMRNKELFDAVSLYVNDRNIPNAMAVVKKLKLAKRSIAESVTDEYLTDEFYNNFSYLMTNKNVEHVFWTLMEGFPQFKDTVYKLYMALESGEVDSMLEFLKSTVQEDYVISQLKAVNHDDIIPYLLFLRKQKVFVSDFIEYLMLAVVNYPNVNWKDAVSRFQLGSKNWMTVELQKLDIGLGNVGIMGGWVGLQARMILDTNIPVDGIISYDLDEEANKAAELINSPHKQFSTQYADIYDIEYAHNTVINAICEHIPDFAKWYALLPAGTLVVLQNNNMTEIEDHINCVHSLEEFSSQVKLTTKLYEGEYTFMNWTRYMIIGYK